MKKKIFLILSMLSIATVSVFADGAITQLDTWGNRIVALFSSTWLQAICIVSLIGLAIGMVTTGRNEQGMFKKFAPWVIGVIIILSASNIVDYFFSGS